MELSKKLAIGAIATLGLFSEGCGTFGRKKPIDYTIRGEVVGEAHYENSNFPYAFAIQYGKDSFILRGNGIAPSSCISVAVPRYLSSSADSLIEKGNEIELKLEGLSRSKGQNILRGMKYLGVKSIPRDSETKKQQ